MTIRSAFGDGIAGRGSAGSTRAAAAAGTEPPVLGAPRDPEPIQGARSTRERSDAPSQTIATDPPRGAEPAATTPH